VDQEVRWLLTEKLVHARTGLAAPWVEPIGPRSRILTSFDSTLEALEYVHAISKDESVRYRNKMWRAIGLEPPGPAEPGQIRLVYLGDDEPTRGAHEILEPTFPQKIAGPRETIHAFGGTLEIKDVEFDDSVTLIRWRISPLPDVDLAFPELAAALADDTAGMDEWAIEHFRKMHREALWQLRVPRFSLEDNVATEYVEHPVGCGGISGLDIKGTTAFTPGTPSHAEHLLVHWLGSTLKITL
jgi:hypothetical protein